MARTSEVGRCERSNGAEQCINANNQPYKFETSAQTINVRRMHHMSLDSTVVPQKHVDMNCYAKKTV
jgi:hypothetical protein